MPKPKQCQCGRVTLAKGKGKGRWKPETHFIAPGFCEVHAADQRCAFFDRRGKQVHNHHVQRGLGDKRHDAWIDLPTPLTIRTIAPLQPGAEIKEVA